MINRDFYVYVWFYVSGDSAVPFYVGLSGDNGRIADTINRSESFKQILDIHKDAYPVKVAYGLTVNEASSLERVIKSGIQSLGYDICDAEENSIERQVRANKGREQKTYKDGSRMKSAVTGNFCGRPAAYDSVNEETFRLIYDRVQRKEITNRKAAELLEIGYTTWYRLIDWYTGESEHEKSYKDHKRKAARKALKTE